MQTNSKDFQVDSKIFKVQGPSESDIYFRNLSSASEIKFENFCKYFLRKDMTAIDIGANIGVTSLILSEYLSQGKIYAIEPGINNFKCLENNLITNKVKNVRAHQIAISDKNGIASFLENSAFGHLTLEKDIEKINIKVKMMRIDDFIKENKIDKVDFIKVDVEGHEPNFFFGAKNVIKQFDPIIYFELNTWCIVNHTNYNPRVFLEWIQDNFKYVYRVNKDLNSDSVLEEIISTDFASDLIYENMFLHQSVNDLVVTNNPEKLNLRLIQLLNSKQDLKNELEHERSRLNQIVNSKVWRAANRFRNFF